MDYQGTEVDNVTQNYDTSEVVDYETNVFEKCTEKYRTGNTTQDEKHHVDASYCEIQE